MRWESFHSFKQAMHTLIPTRSPEQDHSKLASEQHCQLLSPLKGAIHHQQTSLKQLESTRIENNCIHAGP